MFLMNFLLFCEISLFCLRGKGEVLGLGDFSEKECSLCELLDLLMYFTLYSIIIFT